MEVKNFVCEIAKGCASFRLILCILYSPRDHKHLLQISDKLLGLYLENGSKLRVSVMNQGWIDNFQSSQRRKKEKSMVAIFFTLKF